MWLYLLLAVGLASPHPLIHNQARRAALEDLSCKAVNDAYVATFSAPRVSVKSYALRDDGSMKLHDEVRYNEFGFYEKLAVSSRWLRRYRGSLDTVGNHGPLFTSCKFLPASAKDEPGLLHYAATWNDFPFRAPYEVWISADSGRAMKTVRDYSLTTWEFPFPKISEIFDYGPQDAMRPPSNP